MFSFPGTALILGKMPYEKTSEGMRELCKIQVNPLNKVAYRVIEKHTCS